MTPTGFPEPDELVKCVCGKGRLHCDRCDEDATPADTELVDDDKSARLVHSCGCVLLVLLDHKTGATLYAGKEPIVAQPYPLQVFGCADCGHCSDLDDEPQDWKADDE